MDSFRRELAGLIDPAPASTSSDDFRAASIELCLCMAQLFGDSLDRLTLWNRIGSGISTAAAKRPEGGDGMISVALDHVMAEPGKCACNERLARLMSVIDSRDEQWSRSWAAWISRHATIIVTRARAKWQEIKNEK